MLLRPVDMNKALMDELEALGLIRSIVPKEHRETEPVTTLYRNDGQYGGHKLIHVRVERVFANELISHPEGEDFMLIGPKASKELYLIIAKYKDDEFLDKLKRKVLKKEDFYLIRCKFNDEELSFFTMTKGTWHNEMTSNGKAVAPSFYVGESSDLPEYKVATGQIMIGN